MTIGPMLASLFSVMECRIFLISCDTDYVEMFRQAAAENHCHLERLQGNDFSALVRNDHSCYFVDLDSQPERGLYLISLLNEMKDNPCVIVMKSMREKSEESAIRERGITFLLEKPFTRDILDDLMAIKRMRSIA